MCLLLSATRRRLLGGATLLGAGPPAAGTAAIADADLVAAAAAAFCALEKCMQDLIEGPGCVVDEDAREVLLRPLRDEQAPHLARLCSERARSLADHRMRAAAFLAFAGGELGDVARVNGLPADRMLVALIRDLVGAEG